MSYYTQKSTIRIPSIHCKTKTSIIHQRLEQFFARHVKYDYSDDRYTYIVTRITRPETKPAKPTGYEVFDLDIMRGLHGHELSSIDNIKLPRIAEERAREKNVGEHDSNDFDYMEITYTQFAVIYDSPTKEIVIVKPNKLICITDNFSEKEYQRYQYSVQLSNTQTQQK
jgi:hypothetical protein